MPPNPVLHGSPLSTVPESEHQKGAEGFQGGLCVPDSDDPIEHWENPVVGLAGVSPEKTCSRFEWKGRNSKKATRRAAEREYVYYRPVLAFLFSDESADSPCSLLQVLNHPGVPRF